jgi:hypothetical protein
MLSVASAFIGAASGYSFGRRFGNNMNSVLHALPPTVSRPGRWPGRARSNIDPFSTSAPPVGRGNRAFSVFIEPFLSLRPYQRVASLTLLAQFAIGVAAIFVFCVSQAAGLDMRFLHDPSLARLFAEAYPIDESAAFAKTRFDNLFLPLASLYVISLATFAVAVLRSFGPILREIRKYARLALGIAILLGGLWLEFFVRISSGNGSLQRYVIEGNAWGYVVLFVLFPMVSIFLAASLPEDR